MFEDFFSNNDRYTLLLDIGSGSVGAAIVDHEYKTRDNPEACVWSKRLYFQTNEKETFEQNVFSLKSTLLNVILAVNSEGVAALFKQTNQYNLTDIDVVIAAPWVSTIPTRITYEKTEPFLCNHALIKKLSDKATNDAVVQIKENENLTKANAAILNNRATHILVNGYSVTTDVNVQTTNCTFTHYTSLVDTQLQSTIENLLEKSLPSSSYTIRAFLPLFAEMANRLTRREDYLLFDVTYDSTEIAVIRDEALTYATHFDHGLHTIARASAGKNAPLDTALVNMSQFNAERIQDDKNFAAARQSYLAALAEVAEQTTTGFAVPHHVILQVEKRYERFFKHLITEYFNNSQSVKPKITTMSSLLPEQTNTNDTALQLLVTNSTAEAA